MKSDCGIYALKNAKNGKVYIGQSVNLEKRRRTHFWLLRSNRHYNKHLQGAFNNGDVFEFSVIETCNSKEECNQREIYWIREFDATNPAVGYNLCAGGESTTGRICSENTKHRISASRTGKKSDPEVVERRKQSFQEHLKNDPAFAKEHKEKMHQIAKDRGFGGHNRGVPCSEEKKRILSEKLKGRNVSDDHKKKLRELYSGEKSLTAKLKEKDVIDIRIRFLQGERQRDIQKDYNVSPQTIYDIVRCRKWKHIPNNLEELRRT
ncbi:MAG: GIY-YIG nuclease family protein [Oscillospiraceae bacterium]|nr:GIY-YIG nuclease family protein [Oscillospiraceae bacterium]